MAYPTPFARWLFDEASSGTTPTEVADDTGNGNTLDTISYGTANGAWTSIAAGNGLLIGDTTDNDAYARLADISTNGNIGSSLDASKTMTCIMVVRCDGTDTSGSRPILIGPTGEDGDFAVELFSNSQDFRVDLFDGGNGQNRSRTVWPPIADSAVRVIAIVVNTAEATATDRVKVYYNGSAQTDEETTQDYPNQNTQFDYINGTTYDIYFGNRHDTLRGLNGAIFYCELHSAALSATDISDISTALAADNDSTPAAAASAFPYHSIKQQRKDIKTLLTR